MNTSKKAKKPLTVSKYIYKYILLLLVGIFLIVGFFSISVIYKNAKNRTVARLNVAFQVADAQIQSRSNGIAETVRQLSNTTDFTQPYFSGDQETLDQLIRSLITGEDDYYAIIAQDGTILASNVHNAGSKWPLSHLIDTLPEDGSVPVSTEAIALDDLSETTSTFQDYIRIPPEDTMPDYVMLQLATIPILQNNRVCGLFVGGFILNNNNRLADNYTRIVPNTYLSIADTYGLRVCSNIKVNTFSYLEGTFQNSKLVSTTNEGKVWNGIEHMETSSPLPKRGIVIAHPLYNAAGAVVGNYGIGAPIMEIEELSVSRYLLIIFITLLVFFITAAVLHYLSVNLTAPIRTLQHYSSEVAANYTHSTDEIYNRLAAKKFPASALPIEYMDLAESINTMAESLTNENRLLEDKINARTIDMKALILQLEEASNAKNQFLANCTHELRTPLNSILGFTSLMLDDEEEPLSETQTTYLNVIEDSGRHLLRLIDELLIFSRKNTKVETLSCENVNIRELILVQIRAFMPIAHGKKQTLDLIIAEEHSNICAYWDPQRIRQIILNLINNAIKNTPENGTISIEVRFPGSDMCQIDVVDNGTGIDDTMKDKVFQVFEQVHPDDPSNQGLGLGLALCRNWVNMHRGRIWILDADPCGTDVRILLPLNPQPDQPPQQI